MTRYDIYEEVEPSGHIETATGFEYEYNGGNEDVREALDEAQSLELEETGLDPTGNITESFEPANPERKVEWLRDRLGGTGTVILEADQQNEETAKAEGAARFLDRLTDLF